VEVAVAVSPQAPTVVEILVDAVAAEDSKHKLGRQHRFWVIIQLRMQLREMMDD
jgi:hypothetical protein